MRKQGARVSPRPVRAGGEGPVLAATPGSDHGRQTDGDPALVMTVLRERLRERRERGRAPLRGGLGMARPDLSHRVVLGDTEVLGGAAQQQGRGARHLERRTSEEDVCPQDSRYRYAGSQW